MTHGRPTSLGTPCHGTLGAGLSTPPFIGERILGTMEGGIHRGIMTHGTMAIPGDGAILGTIADGTTRGTGILGTMEAGMVAGTEVGTTHGTTADGVMSIIITTATTSSVQAADGSILHA